MNTQQYQKTSRANFKDITHFRLVITTSTNRFQNGWCKSKRLGPGALFRAHWTPGPAFTFSCIPTVCRRKRSKLLFTNQRERFMGMEDAGRQLEETICSSSKKSDIFENVTGAPNDCFLWIICSEKQILSIICYCLRTAKNFYTIFPFTRAIFEAYIINSIRFSEV